ncbi:hnt1 [Ecytonucleospora hepatopenaei]|uniref:Hnt1 n=1 Tax=Ecytonucleospora hepatopenaei TaxID=646526 RepID=A0A1W0E4N2_9MICR|nr:hnt1 [Ecytonucleospora hepatopenaei]
MSDISKIDESLKSCLFCKLKSNKEAILHENEHCFVLVDRFPASECHLLVISKEHYVKLHESNEETLSECVKMLRFLAIKLNLKKYQVVNNNEHEQIVKHMHFHLCQADSTGNYSSTERREYSDEEYKQLVSEFKNKLK